MARRRNDTLRRHDLSAVEIWLARLGVGDLRDLRLGVGDTWLRDARLGEDTWRGGDARLGVGDTRLEAARLAAVGEGCRGDARLEGVRLRLFSSSAPIKSHMLSSIR